jgi:hypothetical protein
MRTVWDREAAGVKPNTLPSMLLQQAARAETIMPLSQAIEYTSIVNTHTCTLVARNDKLYLLEESSKL